MIIMGHAVVWNPGAKRLSDFGDNDYTQMVCLSSGAIEKPIILKPTEEWKGCQVLSTVSSSYCSGNLDPQMLLQWL